MGRDEVIVLDTHAALWIVTESPRLGPRSRKACDAAVEDRSLAVSAITFWEVALLLALMERQAQREEVDRARDGRDARPAATDRRRAASPAGSAGAKRS